MNPPLPTKRLQDWPERLHDFVEKRKAAPFRWGVNDCCLFSADAVQAMTDIDLATDYRGKYSDQSEAFALIKTVTGGSTPEDVMVKAAADHGIGELPSVLYAQRGDVVLYDGEEGPALGVVYLNGIDAMCVSPQGLLTVPVQNTRRAWRV